ncbi:reverse transcriptase domain-containing protein [Tanacetum coccineum]
MSLELADRSIQYPRRIAENVLIKIDKFILPIDFVIIDMREDFKILIILGRPFLATAQAMIDVFNKKITLRVGKEDVIFDVDQSIKRPPAEDDECYGIDFLDTTIHSKTQELLEDDKLDSFLVNNLWVLLLQGFNIEIKDKKGAENLAVDHLSRLENPNMGELAEDEIVDKFPDEHLMILKAKINDEEPWYADYDEPYAFRLCPDNVMRRCVAGNEILEILAHCHSGPTGRHHSASITGRKVYEAGFYWPGIFKDAKDYVMKYDACKKSGNISSRNEMPQNNIQVCEVFDVWGLDFMGPFPDSRGNKYILVVVDYVSKWVEAQALPRNVACAVVKFLKGLFARFRVPKALISDRGTHFCNSQLEKALFKYGVTHKTSKTYHPQTNGQTKVTNRAIKRILERLVGYNPKDWSEKLNEALMAFRTAYKTPTGCTPFKMVYGKACYLLVEIEHKAYWALKQCNMDFTSAAKNHFMELNELMELRDGAYKNLKSTRKEPRYGMNLDSAEIKAL